MTCEHKECNCAEKNKISGYFSNYLQWCSQDTTLTFAEILECTQGLITLTVHSGIKNKAEAVPVLHQWIKDSMRKIESGELFFEEK